MRRQNLRTWVEVSRGNLRHNLRAFQGAIGPTAKIAPVIKANAYGHDSVFAAQTLQPTQIWGFCVAYGSEALSLIPQAGNKPILVLSAWEDSDLTELIRQQVRLVAWDSSAVDRIARAASRVGKRARVHLKIDTGTTRIGVRAETVIELINKIQRTSSIIFDGVFSHYADSEGESLTFARQQQDLFDQLTNNLHVPWKHMACTAASLRLPLNNTNLVRIGIGLYGLWPSDATRRQAQISLRPVLSWKTHVLQVKKIPAGTNVGYGRTFRTKKSLTIATLPIGYSDGYDRRASNLSHVLINNTACPVIGRVSMNLTTVDASRVSRISTNNEVTLIGRGVSANDLAQDWETLHYEVTSRINPAIPRIIIP